MAEKQLWKIHEAVILLEGYLDIQQRGLSRSQVIHRVSKNLRQMALNAFQEIDSIFRNENGISFQMSSMQSAFTGQTVNKVVASRLFLDIVAIYREMPDQYQALLKEAKDMIQGVQSTKELFLFYLSSRIPADQQAELLISYGKIEEHCFKAHVLTTPFFEIMDPSVLAKVEDTTQDSYIFKIMNILRLSNIEQAIGLYRDYLQERRRDYELQLMAADKEGERLRVIAREKEARRQEEERKAQEEAQKLAESRKLEEAKRLEEAQKEKEDRHRAAPPSIENITPPPSTPIHAETETVKEEHLARTEQDKRLLKRYPLIYKRVFKELQRQRTGDSQGMTVEVLYESIDGLGTRSDIENILDNASWARSEGDYYLFLQEPLAQSLPISKKDQPNLETVPQDDNVGVSPKAFYSYLHDTLALNDNICKSYLNAIRQCEDFAQKANYGSKKLFAANLDAVGCLLNQLFKDQLFLRSYQQTGFIYFHAATGRLLTLLKMQAAKEPITSDSVLESISEGMKISVLSESSDQPLRASLPKKRVSPPVQQIDIFKLEPYRNEAYEKTLKEKFSKGFRLDSVIEMKRFRKSYETVNGNVLSDSDEGIKTKILKLCIVHDKLAYHPDSLLNAALKGEIRDSIQRILGSEKPYVYFTALYSKFKLKLLDSGINNVDMLKTYLEYMNNNSYYVGKNYLSRDESVCPDVVDELRACLQQAARPMTYGELYKVLPHVSQKKIQQTLHSKNEFILNQRREYFHVDSFHLSADELDNIATLLKSMIQEGDFVTGVEFYEALKAKCPSLVEVNNAFSDIGFRNVLKYRLGDRFSFTGKIISAVDTDLSMSKVFANFCRKRNSFTLEELKKIAGELGTPIYFEDVYENSLRISEKNFVSKELARFSVKETDEALGTVCRNKYIAIRKVDNFDFFPDAGFPWNSYLLEHYVAYYSKEYGLFHSTFTGAGGIGSIVKRNSELKSFDDLVVDALAASPIQLSDATALQYLCDEGYLARRSLSNIAALVIKAQALRK